MRNKLTVQIFVCLCISFCAVYGTKVGNPTISACYKQIENAVMHQITAEEAEAAWTRIINVLDEAPAKIVSAVTSVNESSKYGLPIDEEGTGTIRQVHAVAGGMVQKTGKNSEYGLYIEIMHEDAVSVYGNLTTAGVVEKERIQRGEIIGSYDSSSENEFYYELRTDL